MPAPLGRDEVFIVRTLDGSDTLYSRRFGTTYHSTNGAVSESRHVFLHAGLDRFHDRDSISILEVGFGTGLNAFLAYLFSNTYHMPVAYTGIEPFPIAHEVARQLDYPAYLAASSARDIFLRMHEQDAFVKNQFSFHRLDAIQNLDPAARFDCIFFDAFSPQEDAGSWTMDVFVMLFEKLNPNGCLVTYCAQGQVRRDMLTVGFEVERLPGAPGKREMLRCTRLQY